MKPAILLLFSGTALFAQFGQPLPGQLPNGQPGQYPGQNPQGRGSSIPGLGRSRKSSSDSKPVEHNISGAIRKIDAKSFDLEAEDTRILTVQITDSTTKPTADLKVGDGVDVVATQDKDGIFQAVSIKSNPALSRKIEAADEPDAAPVEQERTGPPPTILVRPDQQNTDGDAPPKLKRGAPVRTAQDRSSDNAPSTPTASTATASPQRPSSQSEIAQLPPAAREEPAPPRPRADAPSPRMALVEQAREVAASFLDGLPNYVCQELTTRYYSETRTPSWNVIDVIGAEVVFEAGKESYRNLTINGKPSKKPPEESGAWSTGEFGTILGEIYSPGSAARFKFIEEAGIIHRSAAVYDFSVERQRSSWKVSVPGQYIMPAFKGSVWIDKDGAHTLRIEMQGRDIPEEFPLITVETAVDYDYVTLGSPEKFLLPVHAEVLSCKRGSNECERNVIEFRNYHKFTGESVIKFGDAK